MKEGVLGVYFFFKMLYTQTGLRQTFRLDGMLDLSNGVFQKERSFHLMKMDHISEKHFLLQQEGSFKALFLSRLELR